MPNSVRSAACHREGEIGMRILKALIFDVDGTLAETEEVHRAAFNRTFAETGLGWQWDQPTYKQLLKVTGGRERMQHYAKVSGLPEPDCARLHKIKTAHYNDMLVHSGVALRPGVANLVRAARQAGLKLAIATTTSRPNVASLIEATLGPDAVSWFDAICCGEDVRLKKPDPEVYQLALRLCDVGAGEAIAFEDSANGLKAAKTAGIACVASPGMYTLDEDFSNADVLVGNLAAPDAALNVLFQLFDVSRMG